MKWKTKLIAALAALLLAFTLLACDPNVGDGRCTGTACGTNQGQNP
jgi:hypothetical protein